MPQLPALQYLGFALDMTTSSSVNVESASRSVCYDVQSILPSDQSHTVTVGSHKFDVPKNVIVTPDNSSSQNSYTSYDSGTDVVSSLTSDATMSAMYLAVTGDETAYPTGKSFHDGQQYALYHFGYNNYTVSLQHVGNSVNSDVLAAQTNKLPTPFEASPFVIETYKDFFRRVGSHVITGASYGSAFQFFAWVSAGVCSKSTQEFSTDMAAAFNGIPTNGAFDPSVIGTDQFLAFSNALGKLVSVRGGGSDARLALLENPTSYALYNAWVNTMNEDSADLLQFQVSPIWSIMLLADIDNDVITAVQDAYRYIVGNPVSCITPAILSIDASSVEFASLSLDAVVSAHPDFPAPEGVILTGSKIVLKGLPDEKDWLTVVFRITNDGSPFDFSTWQKDGRASVQTRLFKAIDGEAQDAMYFYRYPIAAPLVIPDRT